MKKFASFASLPVLPVVQLANLAKPANWLTFVLLFSVPCFASQTQLKEGNRQFKNGHYDKALKLYDDALIDAPHSPVLRFNAGAAAYQTGDFSRAEKEFKESSGAAMPQLREASHYNQGNTLFRQGRYDDAIEAYKEALRINPKNENAKYNLSVARKAKSEGRPVNGSKGQAGQADKTDKPSPTGKTDQTGSTGETKKTEMSREDAERLLSAAAAGEKKKEQKAQGQGKQVDEDW